MIPGYDYVVQHLDIEWTKRVNQQAGELVVLLRRFCRTGWMVVGKNDRCSPMADSLFHYMARIDSRFLYRPFTDKRRIDDATLGVKAEDIEDFFRSSSHERDQILCHRLGSAEFRSVTENPVMEVATGHLWNHGKENGCLVSNTFHAGNIFRICLQSCRQRPKAPYQSVCCRICITTGDSMEQEEFENLMVIKGIKTFFKKAFSQTLPMTDMEVVIRHIFAAPASSARYRQPFEIPYGTTGFLDLT